MGKFTEVHREMAMEEGVRVEPDVIPDKTPVTEAPATPAPSRSPEIAGYLRTERHYIRDNNNVGYEGLTHQQCADRCTNAFQQLGFECKSFERILDTEIRIANPDALDTSSITRGDI